ncbi:MAG: glycosyltransferase [Chitinophagaceae bacterium]|nr:glycosyltransferase [Chitinophagaceae bacterium]
MNSNPVISVIICTYNRDKYLPQALDSITAQSFDKLLFELIVIDNNSTDRTAIIVKDFITAHPELCATYYFEERKGLGFARNRGLEEASGSILCYVDDDAILSKGYLESVDSFFRHYADAVGAGGKVIPKYESGTEPPWMSKFLDGFVGRVDYGKNIKQFDDKMKYPAGCNMIYRKDILIKVGGFNNDLTFRSDDKDIFLKLKKSYDQIYYLPSAYVYHYVDSHRLGFHNFKRLFLKTGNEEKRRIIGENNRMGLLKKYIELSVKLAGAFILYLLFLFRGKEIKGRYLFLAQWYTWKGFLLKDVFVR